VAIANASDREAQEEQLDWLHQVHKELRAHTGLLREQTKYLRLLYRAAMLWLILVLIGGVIVMLTGSSTPY
jgi:hypothetical protein